MTGYLLLSSRIKSDEPLVGGIKMENRQAKRGLSLFICITLIGSLVIFGPEEANAQPYAIAGLIYADINMNGIYDPSNGDYIISGEPWTDANGNDRFDWIDANGNGLMENTETSPEWTVPGQDTGLGGPNAIGAGNGVFEGPEIWLDQPNAPVSPTCTANDTGNYAGTLTAAIAAGWTRPGSNYIIRNMQPGYHYVTVRCPGFYTQTKNAPVFGNLALNFGLIPFDSIIGRVVKTDGTGICGMWVTATATSAPYGNPAPLSTLIINTLTDAVGNYVLMGLPPGQYRIDVDKTEYIPQQKLNITVDGQTYPNTPFMVNAHSTEGIDFINMSYNYGTITGQVIGPTSTVVEVPGLGLSTTADAAGTYTIGNIPAGWYYVTYKAEGWFIGVQFVCVAPGPGVTTLATYNMDSCGPCTSPTIEGVVTDGIQAIENAIIEVPGMGWVFNTPFEVYTDKAGYYILTNLGAGGPAPPAVPSYITHPFNPTTGRFFVVVRNEAGIVYDEWDDHHMSSSRAVEIVAGRTTKADFKLEENPDYKFGRVTDTNGIGIEGAKVYVPNSPYTTVTDSNGYFFLSLPAETYSEGCFMTWQARRRPGRRAEETLLCGFTDVFQRGIPNTLAAPESANPRRMYKARYLIKAEKPNYFDAMFIHISSPGPKAVNRPPPPQGAEPQAPIDDCEQCMNTLIMTMKTGILKGQIKDSSGNYLNDGWLFICGRDIPISANGWFETLEVPVGTYTAVVTDATKLQIFGVVESVQVRYDQITYKNITLPASPPGKFISGFVYHNTVRRTVASDGAVDQGGNWQGYIIPDQNGYSPGSTFEPGEGISGVAVKTTFGGITAYSDSYGFYVIRNIVLPTGTSTTTIVASKGDYITLANPTVGPSDGLNFVNGFAGGAGVTVFPLSKRRGTLNGRVVNEDGRDVSGATLSVWIPWERKDETDTNGFYIFENLEIGTYLMKICGGGECGIDYWVTYSVNEFGHGEPVVLNSIVTKDFTYKKRTGRVHGFVTNNAVPPQLLQDAEVVLSGKYKELTDCNGYYTILNVPTGTHTGTAYKAGYQMRKYQDLDASIGVGWSWFGGVPVRADWAAAAAALPVPNPVPPPINTPLLSMTTTPLTGWISGYLTLELSDGFCEVNVRVNPSGQHVVTDSEGYYIILNIQPWDQYYLHMEITNYEVETKGPIAVSAGIETKVSTAHMRRYTCQISGYVRDGAEPIAGVQVKLSDMHRTQLESSLYRRYLGNYMTTTDGTGYYEFNDVPWSDAQISDLNKTWAWTVVASKTDFYVGVLNVIVVWPDCGVTNANINLISMNGGISGTVTWDPSCATQATVTASQVLGGSGGGSVTVSNSGDTYLIKNLPPGAYDVTAVAGTCVLPEPPPPPYTGAYAIPVNSITTDVDFAFELGGGPQPPPDAPSLLNPPNGASGTSCTPTLDWTDSTGATTYTVQVSVSSDFTSTLVNQVVSSSQYTIPSGVLMSFTKYYWRANATNVNGTSGWSPTWNFTTGDCGGVAVPDVPTLISPTNESSDTSCTPTLDWTDSTGATSYTVEVSTESSFSSTIVSPTVTVSQYTIPDATLSSYTTYYWRVNASNSAGTSGWSSVWNFTTGDCGWVCPGNVCGTTDPPNCTVKAYLVGHLKDSTAPYYYETTSDGDGHFYFNLPTTSWDPLWEQEREPSTYNIVVLKDGYAAQFKTVEVENSSVTWYDRSGGGTNGNFTLGTSGTDISGTVTDGTSALQGTVVRAFDTDFKGTLVKLARAVTDASGDYQLGLLPSGRTYIVSASKSNYTIKSNNVSTNTSSNDYVLQQADGSSVISYTIPLRFNPADNLYDIGWNMVSIPLNVDADTPLPVLLYDIDEKWMQITRLKPGTGITPPGHAAGGAWEIYPNSPLATDTADVFTMHETTFNGDSYRYGYWIKVEGNTTEQTYNWVIVGTPNTQKTIDLKAGWNLIGLASQTDDQTFPNGVQITFSPDYVLQIWSYDAYGAGDAALGDHWYAYVEGGYQSPGFTLMKLGHAYYVYVSQDCTMTYA
jgi:hypothetical protein